MINAGDYGQISLLLNRETGKGILKVVLTSVSFSREEIGNAVTAAVPDYIKIEDVQFQKNQSDGTDNLIVKIQVPVAMSLDEQELLERISNRLVVEFQKTIDMRQGRANPVRQYKVD